MTICDKAISNWENDSGKPDISYFKISKILHIDAPQLLEGMERIKK